MSKIDAHEQNEVFSWHNNLGLGLVSLTLAEQRNKSSVLERSNTQRFKTKLDLILQKILQNKIGYCMTMLGYCMTMLG